MKINLKTVLSKYYIFIILIISILGFYFVIRGYETKLLNINTLHDAVLDKTIKTYTDEVGILTAEVGVLQLSELKLLSEVNTKDSTINRLKSTIKQERDINTKLQTVIGINTQAIAKYSDSLSNTIIKLDSVIENGNLVLYPTYERKIDMFDKWITGKVELGKNVTYMNIEFIGEYDIIIERHRKNLLKPYETIAKLKTYNPYDQTKNFVVIEQDKLARRFNVSAIAAYGIGNNGFSPFIGIGVGYTIFNF